jgi:hypothetical protein
LPVYAIKYEAFLCSLQCGGACGRCLACDGLCQPPTGAWWTSSGRNVGCSHVSRQHYGDRSAPRRRHTRPSEVAPKWASGSTWFGKGGLTGRKCRSEFLCPSWWLSRPAAPSRGVCPAGCARSTPLRRPPADGAPPAGPWQEPN